MIFFPLDFIEVGYSEVKFVGRSSGWFFYDIKDPSWSVVELRQFKKPDPPILAIFGISAVFTVGV